MFRREISARLRRDTARVQLVTLNTLQQFGTHSHLHGTIGLQCQGLLSLLIVAAVNAEAWGRNQQGSLSFVPIYIFTLDVAAKKVDAPRAAAHPLS